jgi:hypothetical protein
MVVVEVYNRFVRDHRDKNQEGRGLAEDELMCLISVSESKEAVQLAVGGRAGHR